MENDFNLQNVNDSTVIPLGAFQTCFEIEATDDHFVENDELFTLVVEAINPNDLVSTNATIIISDNDGKNMLLYWPCNLFVS